MLSPFTESESLVIDETINICCEAIKYLIDHKIAVMGHIGVKPQSINNHKEFKILGKNQDEAKEIFDDAISLESSGVFSLVLELVDEFLTKKITKKLSIPTIGISSGNFSDGQVQVYNDLIGYSPKKLPKHAKVYSNLFFEAQESINKFVNDTRDLS